MKVVLPAPTQYAPRVESIPDDGAKHVVGARWWVPWLMGFLVSGMALVALGTAFPVATLVIAGYGSTFGAAWKSRGRAGARATRGHWVAAGLSVLLFAGLGLLLGAAGFSIDDAQRGNAVPGAVVGGVLLAVGGGVLLAMAIAARRRRTRAARSPD
ncbi:hypothetical protein EDF55_0932 [Curtobacterium sp. ZW137]|nr:hypothetical protein EDF55_0932 [Curtobacterium sp. ZW137]